MPFDSKDFVETKPAVFSLEGLAAWLAKQPAKKRYCYLNAGACLLHQYVAASGLPIKAMYSNCWISEDGTEHKYPHELNTVAVLECTFGGALQRASRMVAERRS